MSSTSGEVCELFNGKSIIRVMGKPKIAQILVFPKQYDNLKATYERRDCEVEDADKGRDLDLDTSCGIHSFKTACDSEQELMSRERKQYIHLRTFQV